ncbi:MAG: hypothetical protein ACRDTS_00370 [Mycobacterium sp.]
MAASVSRCPPAGLTGRGQVFRYESYRIDAYASMLTCRYSLDGRPFEEWVTFSPAASGQWGHWDAAAVSVAARLVFLLIGVTYYKTAAPPVIDLGQVTLTEFERDFLRDFYLEGLGEFGYRNGIDLSDLRITGGVSPEEFDESSVGQSRQTADEYCTDGCRDDPLSPTALSPIPPTVDGDATPLPRVLIPFGGGIDSIVTVEMLRRHVDAALLVVSIQGEVFEAIEPPAAVTGLPVIHVNRELDRQLLRADELGFLRGHVPVTGILSAIAIMAAVLADRDAVVMSNEWSASAATLVHDGRPINHQYSKSAAFEVAFRQVLGDAAADLSAKGAQPGSVPTSSRLPDYFSALRHRTELWIAKRFAELCQYHGSFRSCNGAFNIVKARRLDHWCGRCDKCCFIDLILAPFLSATKLDAIFGRREPLADPSLAEKFRALLGVSADSRPFECVGEVGECRAATLLAIGRLDRVGYPLLRDLASEVSALPDTPDEAELLRPVDEHFIPARYAIDELVDG